MRSSYYRSVERRAVRMHQMMHRLDIDPVAFGCLDRGEVYAQARSRCLSCITIGDCLRWLDGYGFERRNPDFCPNFNIFLTLKEGSTLDPARRCGGPSGGLLAA